MKYLIMWLVTMVLLNSCTMDSGLVSKEVELTGINGPAYYHFDLKSNKVIMVIKKEYAQYGDYIIDLNKDTLSNGEVLKVHFNIYHQDYKILIESPTIETIKGSHIVTPGKPRELDSYAFKTKKTGTFTLKGRIEYDTVLIPFEYKYLVTKK